MPWYSPFSWFRRSAPSLAAPEPRETLVPALEAPSLAAPGTARSGGTLQTDVRLSPRDMAVKGRRIRRTEPRVQSSAAAFSASVGRLTWRFEPGSQAPAGLRNADFMNRQCGTGRYRRGMMASTWSTLVASAARCVDHGFMTGEVGTLRREDGLLWIRDVRFPAVDAISPNPWHENTTGQVIRQRAPVGLFSVEVQPKDLLRIDQMGPNGETGHFEAYRALHFRDDEHAAEWDGGGGRLRPCLPFYDLAQTALRALGVGVQRFGAGTLRVVEDRAKGRTMGYTDAEITETVGKMLVVAEQLRAEARTAFVEVAGVRIEAFAADWDPQKCLAVYDFAVRQMRAAYAAAQLDISEGGSGSYNSGQVLARSFATQVGHTADRIAATINGRRSMEGTLFRALFDNFGVQLTSDLPVLVHKGVVETPWHDQMTDLVVLLQGDASERVPGVVREILDAYGLPVDDLDDLRTEIRRRSDEGAEAMRAAGLPANVTRLKPPSVDLAQRIVDARRYTARNRDVREMFGQTTGGLNGLLRRGAARGIEPPCIGDGHSRRWDPAKVNDWYRAVASREAA